MSRTAQAMNINEGEPASFDQNAWSNSTMFSRNKFLIGVPCNPIFDKIKERMNLKQHPLPDHQIEIE